MLKRRSNAFAINAVAPLLISSTPGRSLSWGTGLEKKKQRSRLVGTWFGLRSGVVALSVITLVENGFPASSIPRVVGGGNRLRIFKHRTIKRYNRLSSAIFFVYQKNASKDPFSLIDAGNFIIFSLNSLQNRCLGCYGQTWAVFVSAQVRTLPGTTRMYKSLMAAGNARTQVLQCGLPTSPLLKFSLFLISRFAAPSLSQQPWHAPFCSLMRWRGGVRSVVWRRLLESMPTGSTETQCDGDFKSRRPCRVFSLPDQRGSLVVDGPGVSLQTGNRDRKSYRELMAVLIGFYM